MGNYARDANVFTAQHVESGNYTSYPDAGGPGDATGEFGSPVLSAFSPTVYSVNDPYNGIITDDFNNWYPELNCSNPNDYNFSKSGS